MKQIENSYTAPWPGGSGRASLPSQFRLATKPVLLLLLQRCPDLDFMEQKHFHTNGRRRKTYMKLPTIHFAVYGYSEKTTTDKTAFTSWWKDFNTKKWKNRVTDYKPKDFYWQTRSGLYFSHFARHRESSNGQVQGLRTTALPLEPRGAGTELSGWPLCTYLMGCVRWLLHLSFHLPLHLPFSQKIIQSREKSLIDL